MSDPLSLAATAAKIGSAVIASRYRPNGQQRVGGREERRHVYTRFQEAVVAYVIQIRDSRVSPELMKLEFDERKPYMDALLRAMTEFAQALHELRLVGNPEPIEAAEIVCQAVADSFESAAARREALTDAEMRLYVNAMHDFTSACREDLWYQPRWWQPWRSGWRKALRVRRQRRRTMKEGRVESRPVGQLRPEAEVSKNGQDVAFGGAQLTSNLLSGTSDVVVQTRDVSGVVFHKKKRGHKS
ncbi:hypothetical protein AB0A74_00390 [Saccharothrix sp. NPDC042600]|uniref:hypothetical protein n=1 Tax=Saccharothrix TaxID=2071 RepID=UPI003401E4EF|nr:hypothetical protein GCM10017745_47580 [Saccharothrix mutabilis subsp. capreolus]